jgi:serine/threonine-protein kinase ATR
VDETNGDCVHVDFNCLFSKGLDFPQPEKVPFRLTHNMVDAMGLSGYEGVFRRVCELTLHVLRNNRETLMSVLETFIHDPLVEWTKGKLTVSYTNCLNEHCDSLCPLQSTGEQENEQAVKIIRDIDDRLKGKVGKGLPLSVEGQVHQQIEKAVNHQNLAAVGLFCCIHEHAN